MSHNGGSANVLYGFDERYLHGLSAGCPGAVGSTYNFAAPLYRRIQAAHERGEMEAAESDQARSAGMIGMFKERDYLPTAKAVMALVGIDCGPVRPPLSRLSPTQIGTLRDGLDAMGFFAWAVR